MKLIGDLKEKVEAASSKEEARTVIAQAGMELTMDELDAVSGGFDSGWCEPSQEIMDLWASMADGEERTIYGKNWGYTRVRRYGNELHVTKCYGAAEHLMYMCGTGNVGGATCRHCGSPIPANQSGGICPFCGDLL